MKRRIDEDEQQEPKHLGSFELHGNQSHGPGWWNPKADVHTSAHEFVAKLVRIRRSQPGVPPSHFAAMLASAEAAPLSEMFPSSDRLVALKASEDWQAAPTRTSAEETVKRMGNGIDGFWSDYHPGAWMKRRGGQTHEDRPGSHFSPSESQYTRGGEKAQQRENVEPWSEGGEEATLEF